MVTGTLGPSRSAMRKIATVFGLLLLAATVGVFAFTVSGVYDVSATTPHFGVTWRMMRMTLEGSVKRRARNITVPDLDDPEKVHRGLKTFQEMCVTCHGAPGAPKSEISKGLYPPAPNLAEAAKNWTPAELYVITKLGVKMTGMPAWGPTHSEEELWSLVAFMRLFPTMPASEYVDAEKYFVKNANGMAKDMHGDGR